MKEELLKVLNIKLKYLDDNISTLSAMNASLELENNKLGFEPITYVPFDLDGIDVSMLDEKERKWIKAKSKKDGKSSDFQGFKWVSTGIFALLPP